MAETTVIGNVGGEPEMRFTQNGKAVLNFSVAENHSKKDGQGQWQDDGTTWRKVSLWDRRAEALAEVLKKGDRVVVVGSERIREFETRDGGRGQSLEMTAREVGIIPKLPQQGGFQQQSGSQQGAPTWGQEHAGQGRQGDPWAASNVYPDQPPF